MGRTLRGFISVVWIFGVACTPPERAPEQSPTPSPEARRTASDRSAWEDTLDANSKRALVQQIQELRDEVSARPSPSPSPAAREAAAPRPLKTRMPDLPFAAAAGAVAPPSRESKTPKMERPIFMADPGDERWTCYPQPGDSYICRHWEEGTDEGTPYFECHDLNDCRARYRLR